MNKLKSIFFTFAYIMFVPLIIIYGAFYGAVKECIDVWKLMRKIIKEEI